MPKYSYLVHKYVPFTAYPAYQLPDTPLTRRILDTNCKLILAKKKKDRLPQKLTRKSAKS